MKTGGVYILLDKFIEINAPLEEAKLLRSQTISDKSKPSNKLVGIDKNDLKAVNANAPLAKTGSPNVKKNKK